MKIVSHNTHCDATQATTVQPRQSGTKLKPFFHAL
jgi:hypothetical protein